MLPHFRRALLCALLVLIAAPIAAFSQTRLLRFPDIHDDRIAFCHAGDIWVASSKGGTALRLTTHPGQELFPKFSPDGNWVAFTGQYDGDEQVYVVSAKGGSPKQLTFYSAAGPLPPRWGFDNQVYGWTVDGKAVLFRSMRYGWDLTDTQLFTVSLDGGLPEPLPMPVSGAGDYAPDGKRIVYSPLIRDFRTWKRYQGGWAQDLWIFDLGTLDVTRVTESNRTDRDPMWIGNTIYFASDRDGTLNLYAYDVASKQTSAITQGKQYDVRWPSADRVGNIVYELGGELHVYDSRNGADRTLSVYVPNDGVAMRPTRKSAGDNIEHWGISPNGKRAVFAARGDIFTVPVEHGPTRNLTNTSNAHDKWPAWSPDGTRIAFISDLTGEEEIYIIAQDGSGAPEQLTTNGSEMRYRPEWSPDEERIAFSDKNGRLVVLDVMSRKSTQVADEKGGFLNDFSWSPQGGHIAFAMSDETGFNSVYIWSGADAKVRRITGAYFNEWNPVWDPKGDYLFYLSDRMFQPQIGSIEWNYLLDRESGIYALALRKDVAHPLPPRSDEEEPNEDEDADDEKKGKKDDKKKDKKKEALKIDFDGLADRVTRIPVTDDNYYGLAAVEGKLVFVRTGPFYYGRSSDIEPAIQVFSFEDRKVETMVENAGGYALTLDGKQALVASKDTYKLYDVKAKASDPKRVATDQMMADVIPAQEYVQIFNEVWRRFRDFFYAENMHGYDWAEIGSRYRALLPHVAHRSDLNYVLGEMIAELNVSHAYISGGDYDLPDRPASGLAGARFELDREEGRYRIAHIYRGHNEESRYRSPLRETGVNVSVGDYVLAIDGVELTAASNPYRELLNKSERPVVLTVNSSPSMKGARTVKYVPIGDEDDLIYLDWVLTNMEKVNAATGGRVGYLHIPDMGSNGIREFIKWFYPQIRKEGLVIDVRGNGGGNVSQMLIERLNRKLLSIDYSRNSEYASPYPATVFTGHLVCLLNETSASDGDIFPAMFREAGLGPLIGKRSWGGVIGISGRGPLIDGGSVFVPEFGFVSRDGEWSIENHGVDPDIVVENDPKSVIEGRDPQLERGIAEVLKAMDANPRGLTPKPKQYPVRTK